MDDKFNLNYWPIVYFKSSIEPINDLEFEEYKKFYLQLLVRCKNNNEKMTLICDLNNTKEFQMDYVMKQAQFNREIYNFNKQYVKCIGIMCGSKNFMSLKNIINIFATMVKPPAPFKLCKNFNKINIFLQKNNINFDVNIFNNLNSEINNNEQDDNIYSEECSEECSEETENIIENHL